MTTKKENKARVSIALDKEVYEMVSILAEDDDRSVSAMINTLLKKQLLAQTSA